MNVFTPTFLPSGNRVPRAEGVWADIQPGGSFLTYSPSLVNAPGRFRALQSRVTGLRTFCKVVPAFCKRVLSVVQTGFWPVGLCLMASAFFFPGGCHE